jgi:hypothetical protein
MMLFVQNMVLELMELFELLLNVMNILLYMVIEKQD